MSSAISTPSPRKLGEVDTSKPYSSVLEAILKFDNPSDVKSSPEQKRAYESPVVKLKEQLAEAVAAKESVESDNSTLEREVAELKLKLQRASERPLAADGEAGGHADDTYLHNMYEMLLAARNRAQQLEASITASDIATEAVVKRTEDAEATANNALKTFEDMSNEMAMAADRHQAEIAQSQSQIQSLTTELSDVKQHEGELANEVSTLKDTVAGLIAELNKVNEELNTLKSSEARALASLGETSVKLQALEAQLKEVEDEKITLQATTRYLEPELESTKAELEALKSENADEDVVEKYKGKLEAARALQGKQGEEAVSGVLEGLEQVMAESIEAQVVKESVDEYNRSMHAQTVEFKAAAETAEKKMEEAGKEVDAAKLGEASAVEIKKSLSSNGGFEDEHLAKIHEVENSTSKKIAEAEAEVEAINENEKELKKKLDEARAEIEASKLDLKEANEKATKAEAAKSAVEGELRRWRSENEQRRKQAQALAAAGVYNGTLMKSGSNVVQPRTSVTLKASMESGRSGDFDERRRPENEGRRLSHQGESLADVLQIKVPVKEAQELEHQISMPDKKKKKLKLLARLSSVFSPKKRR